MNIIHVGPCHMLKLSFLEVIDPVVCVFSVSLHLFAQVTVDCQWLSQPVEMQCAEGDERGRQTVQGSRQWVDEHTEFWVGKWAGAEAQTVVCGHRWSIGVVRGSGKTPVWRKGEVDKAVDEQPFTMAHGRSEETDRTVLTWNVFQMPQPHSYPILSFLFHILRYGISDVTHASSPAVTLIKKP